MPPFFRIVAWSAVLVTLCGCGGADTSGPSGGRPLPPPPPGTTYAASGVVYARSDTIAYAAEATSAPFVSGASLTFGSSSASAGSGGSYSISAATTLVGDFLPVSASAPGYQAGWSPFLTYENSRPVNVALYPEVAVTPRPGFVKGIDFMDSGGGLGTIYNNGLHAQVMDRVRTQDRATLVMTTEHFGVTSFRVSTNSVEMAPDPFGVYSRAVYMNLASQARARGLQFMMTLPIAAYQIPGNQASIDAASKAEWDSRFQIPASNEAFWNAFFAAWKPLITDRATIARDAGIEYLSLGFNLGFLTRTNVSRWRQLIADIRATGYTGKITYFWDPRVHDGFSEWNAGAAILPLFDVIGMRMSTVVARSSASEVLARTQTRARMRSSVAAAIGKLSGASAPLVILLTVPSVHGGVVDPEFIEPCIIPSCGSTALQRTRDFQQQADAYEAVAEAINATPTGNGRVMGLITAQYWYYENFQSGGGGAYDRGTNIRGKPAEMVLKWWFERW